MISTPLRLRWLIFWVDFFTFGGPKRAPLSHYWWKEVPMLDREGLVLTRCDVCGVRRYCAVSGVAMCAV